MAKRKTAPEASADKATLPSGSTPSPAEASVSTNAAEYTVLARRYRPQQFSDLIGQEPVAQALINALQTNRVAHAYLFTGVRGVGKTSAARILAKALNCVNGPTATPCDQCDSCQAIMAGEDIDVLEIDGASNNGINEIREVRQNVQFRPSRSRYKIYIIDEVHMLTTQAFNALLKTLEEPPSHVKFIFATTEVQKIPITILSRCQRFDFAGIGLKQIVDRLRHVVEGEHMQADDDALELVARRAGGSMRDAQSLLDQLLAFGSEKLTREQVHKLLGTADEDRVTALAGAVLAREAGKALELLDQFLDHGCQMGELLDQLIAYWRDLMVVQCTGEEIQVLSVVGAARKAMQQQAKQMGLDTILAGLDLLATAKSRLRSTSHGRVIIEMALVRLARLEDLVSLSQLAQLVGTIPVSGASPRPGGTAPTGSSASRPPPGNASTPAAPEKKKVAEGAEGEHSNKSFALNQHTLSDFYAQLIQDAGFALSHELRKAEPAISEPKTLVLRFPAGYNLPLETSKKERLEQVVQQLAGEGWHIREESTGGPAATRSVTAPGSESSLQRARRLRDEMHQLPVVQKAMDVLGAQIVRVDEGFGTMPEADSRKQSVDKVAHNQGPSGEAEDWNDDPLEED